MSRQQSRMGEQSETHLVIGNAPFAWLKPILRAALIGWRSHHARSSDVLHVGGRHAGDAAYCLGTSNDRQDILLCKPRSGADALPDRRRPRGTDQGRHNDASGKAPVCLAASVRSVPLCGIEQWRGLFARRCGRPALSRRRSYRPRQRRAAGAWCLGRAAVASDPRQRRPCRTLCPGRLQQSKQRLGAPDQRRRHRRRGGKAGRVARLRDLCASDSGSRRQTTRRFWCVAATMRQRAGRKIPAR